MRVLVTGNCHGQYLGAALSTVPGVEVRVWGLAYPGPVHFQGVLPQMLSGKEARRWVKGGVILRQVTTQFPPIPDPADRVSYPYFEVRDRFGAGASHFTNEQAFALAGLDLAPVMKAIEAPGAAMDYNKFSGAVFASLLEQLQPTLGRYIPCEPLSRLIERMRLDRGLAHGPHPSLLKDPPNAELADQAAWIANLNDYRSTGSPGALARCLSLYRPRRYMGWAMEMAQAMMGRKRVAQATRLLCSHLAYEDARGRLFAHALTYCFQIRTDFEAFKVLERAADAAPQSSLPLWLACVGQMN